MGAGDMVASTSDTLGIPAAGAFDASAARDAAGLPLGTHVDGQWQVPHSINRATQSGDLPWRRYRNRPQSYDAMIRRSAARYAKSEAVICGERRVSWAEFDDMIERTA